MLGLKQPVLGIAAAVFVMGVSLAFVSLFDFPTFGGPEIATRPPASDVTFDVGHEGGPWRTSSHSGSAGSCVEFADFGDHVAVRDSKHPNGFVIRLTRAEWRAFVEAVKRDDFTA